MPVEGAVPTRQSPPPVACPTLDGSACAPYAVQGVLPRSVLLPESEEDAAAALAACSKAGLAVTPWGGGTLQAVGYPPERLDAVLSLERLNGVITYEPADLTISVQAGCTVQCLHDTLAPNGQLLPFSCADPERATIGGLVATNLAGPRRFGGGSYRDLLIGVRVAAPDGTISKAGGLVVKNVSGYDLMKLHLGALGTLGLLLRLNFKVLTRPAIDLTAIISGEHLALLALAQELAGSQLLLDSLELLGPGAAPPDSGWRLAARLTGSARGVARKQEEVLRLGASHGLAIEWREGNGADAWWQDVAHFLHPVDAADTALLRLATLPAALGGLLEQVEALASGSGLVPAFAAHAGNGILFARLTGSGLPGALPGVLDELGQRWGNVTVLAAPPAVKQALNLWGPLPASFPLMQRIKAQFDPTGTLNPGRYLGRL